MKKFIAYANEEWVFASLVDKTTGVEVHKITFGKNYHWWIITTLAVIGFLLKHF